VRANDEGRRTDTLSAHRLVKAELASRAMVPLPRAVAVSLACVLACSHPHDASTPSTALKSPATPPQSSCFLLYELGVGEVRRPAIEACSTRVTPASTFKIPHALAALDSGVLSGADVTFAYDGTPDVPDTWKRSHTLATAMRYSVVWYFQRVASLLGPDREHAYLAKLDYGNQDSSSGLTTFWLDESLKISPEEQEHFLVRLYEDALPVSKLAMKTVRDILVQPPGVVVNAWGEHAFDAPWPEGTVVSAKTGSGDDVLWLVGHVDRGHHSWVFVSCVVGTDLAPLAAIELAARSLRAEHVL
jgi:beta-lactamase class D